MCRIHFPAGKHNANLSTILVHLQLQRAQRGKEFGFSWQVESSSKQSKAFTILSYLADHKSVSASPSPSDPDTVTNTALAIASSSGKNAERSFASLPW